MNDLHERITRAKAKLPLDIFMQKRGFGEFVKASCKSPFRDEKTPSWGVFTDEKGELKWKDFTTGETGDQIDFLATELGCSTNEALRVFLEEAGESKPAPAPRKKRHTPPPAPTPEPEPEAPVTLNPFDWQACVDALTPEEIQKFAEWRGYSPEFVTWLKEQRYVGMYQGCPATPVIKDGAYVGCQYRTKEGPRYANATPGAHTPALPLVIGNPESEFLLVMESQWDGFAILEYLGAHKSANRELLCLGITRSASNHAKLAPLLEARAKSSAPGEVILVGQNDKPRPDGKPTGHDTLEAGVRKLCADYGLTPKVVFPPKVVNDKAVKDVNDWIRADRDADIASFLDAAKASTKSKLSIRSVKELRGMKLPEDDNYFADRFLAEGQSVTFLGPGAVGKSRLVLQLAICMITGHRFLGIETHAAYKPWLVIQTENSNRRLQTDLNGMVAGLKLSESEIEALDENLFFHTVENEGDAFLDLCDREEFATVQNLITDLNPTFVVFDPLNTFTTGDLNGDVDMRAVCTAITRAVKRGNPKRVPIVLHHAITGKAGVQKAIGWDKASFGRNSKVLFAWTRGQMNIAPRDPEDETKLLISCGKNSNGRYFQDIAVKFDEETKVYMEDDDYDAQEFKEEVGLEKKSKGGRPSKKPELQEIIALMNSETIPMYKLKYAIVDEFKMSKTNAYYAIKDCEKAGLITLEKVGKQTLCYLVS